MVHSSNTPFSSSSMLGHPVAALTNKRKGKATAMLHPTLAQGSSTPLLTTWKMVKQHFSAKEKGKGKAKEPKPSIATDEQIAHLLQQLHKAGVPEDVGADVLNNSIVQLALAQVLNKLDVVCNQRDKTQTDLFHSALGKEKCVAFPPELLEAKKACTKPSVFVEGFSTQRAPPVPYLLAMTRGWTSALTSSIFIHHWAIEPSGSQS
ncbi:hypothetical protein C0989_000613 [Termitomyces sp. Mn162]|nr:hypothetical protein C0989_000613 [Termitomyces sp. Mn162]